MSIQTKPKKQSRRQLLVLTSTFPRYHGDPEPSFVYELCRRLARTQNVTVIAPHAPGVRYQEIMAGINVQRFRYAPSRMETLAYNGGIIANLKQNPLRYGLVPFFVLSQFFNLIKILWQKDIDIIHAHWLIPQGVVSIFGRFFTRKTCRVLCTSHGGDLYGLRGRFANWLKKLVIRNADAVTVVSEAMLQEAMKRAETDAGNIKVISMGVDAEATFTPGNIERSEKELLFVGRLVEKKGVTYLLGAMPFILEKYPNTILSIVGNGPEKERLQRQVKQLGIENRVRFLGALAQSELPDLYRRATVFVAPSVIAKSGDQEGLGLVFAEAMACECAVVASDLPAIADVITADITGLIARQKDSQHLAIQVLRLLDNPKLCQQLGQAGRQDVLRRFDWEIISGHYARLIAGLVDAPLDFSGAKRARL